MSAKYYLMRSLLMTFAWGALSAAWAEDVSVIPVQSASEKSSERISLQTLKNLRDPFKRMGLDIPDSHDDKPKSELETVPVSDFKMVGVLTGPYKTRALVRSPSGSVYTISDGTRIGVQNGYVRKVLRDRIIVNEILQDVLGEKELVTSELKLNTKGVEKGVSSVQAVLSSNGSSKKAENDEAHAKEKQGESKDSAPAAAKPAAPVPASATAPASKPAAAAPISGNFNLAVPAPIALPQGNGSQQTAGSK